MDGESWAEGMLFTMIALLVIGMGLGVGLYKLIGFILCHIRLV